MHKRSDIVWPFMLKGYGIDRMMIEVVFLKIRYPSGFFGYLKVLSVLFYNVHYFNINIIIC